MNTFKGIIHVHSNYSHDGRHSLQEIALFAKKRGYSFVCMSEHSDTLNDGRMSEYVQECRRVSTARCMIIPGIEFSCDNKLHIVGIGIDRYTGKTDPAVVAAFIRERGGVAIVAHPVRYNYDIPLRLIPVIDGIEVWSASYDGRFVPNHRSLLLYKQLKTLNTGLSAFAGQDLHGLYQHFLLEISVRTEEVSREAVTYCLKHQNFKISNPYFVLHSREDPGRYQLQWLHVVRLLYLLSRRLRDVVILKKNQVVQDASGTRS